MWEEVVALIQEFVTGARSPVSSDRVLMTILFTDIAASTERAAAIGDAAWRDVLQRYYTITRRALTVFGGNEVDTAGDGLLATFDGPARAIRCARSIQRETLPLDPSARPHSRSIRLPGLCTGKTSVHATVHELFRLSAPVSDCLTRHRSKCPQRSSPVFGEHVIPPCASGSA
jgi:class 3 adenylate cyclase